MRTYGRNYNEDGTYTWVEVTTDANEYNDNVYLTALAQALQLNLNESPTYANTGIPQQQTIITQVFPDYYVALMQNQFAPYFASLQIARVPNTNPPTYNINAVSHSGAILSKQIAT